MCFPKHSNKVTGQTFSSQLWDSTMSNSPLTHLIKLGKGGERRLVELTRYLRLFFHNEKKPETHILLLFSEIISDVLIYSFDLIRTPGATCQLQIHWTVVLHASSDWITFQCRSRQVTWQSCQGRGKRRQKVKTWCYIHFFKLSFQPDCFNNYF